MEQRDRRKRPPTPQRSIEATSLFKIRAKGGGHTWGVSAWRETWGRPSSLTAHRHERRRSEGWKEGGKMGEGGAIMLCLPWKWEEWLASSPRIQEHELHETWL